LDRAARACGFAAVGRLAAEAAIGATLGSGGRLGGEGRSCFGATGFALHAAAVPERSAFAGQLASPQRNRMACRHHDAIISMTSSKSLCYPSGMSKENGTLKEEVAALTVRVPREIVSDIDRERNARRIRVPRNTWILEAVVEKLRRDAARADDPPEQEQGHGTG